MDFVTVIPARYASSRLPGKPLSVIGDKTMIEWVAAQALKSGSSRVVVATDSELVAEKIQMKGVEVCMTSEKHSSGSERIAEVCEKLGFSDDTIVVNVQGDEPLMPPELIRNVARDLEASGTEMSTVAVKITDASEISNPNAVKTVLDKFGNAMYFSRSSIPTDRDGKNTEPGIYLRHLGIYAYRAGFLKQFVKEPQPVCESLEKLEQLRALYMGAKIHVMIADNEPPAGVDTAEDLEKVRSFVKLHGLC